MRGYTLHEDEYLTRLRKIEGQVRGLQRMIQDDRYCIDILDQISSVTSALENVAIGLVDEHVRHCVVEATDPGEGDAKLTEALDAVARLLRT